ALVTDPALRAAAERAVAPSPNQIDRRALDDVAFSIVLVSPPPVTLASDVWLRQGTKEWPAGAVVLSTAVTRPNSERWFYSGSCHCPGLEDGSADIVLRPSPAAAARTTEVTEIWGRDVVI